MRPQVFRQKIEIPIVEAVQFTGGNARDIVQWVRGQSSCHHPDPDRDPVVYIDTSQGLIQLDPGEMVVKTPAGTFLVMSFAEFDSMYEHVD